jgi:hypothetical protein
MLIRRLSLTPVLHKPCILDLNKEVIGFTYQPHSTLERNSCDWHLDLDRLRYGRLIEGFYGGLEAGLIFGEWIVRSNIVPKFAKMPFKKPINRWELNSYHHLVDRRVVIVRKPNRSLLHLY